MSQQLTRRKTLGGLLACAGAAAFGNRSSRAKDIKAPVGDAAPLTELGMELSAEQRAAGVAFLERHVTVDTHSHPGRFFLKRLTDQTPTTRSFGEPFEDQAIADLSAGNVSGTLFCAVADMRLLEMTPAQGLHAARDWTPGEAYADYRRQIPRCSRVECTMRKWQRSWAATSCACSNQILIFTKKGRSSWRRSATVSNYPASLGLSYACAAQAGWPGV
jgi:hypothetical protein